MVWFCREDEEMLYVCVFITVSRNVNWVVIGGILKQLTAWAWGEGVFLAVHLMSLLKSSVRILLTNFVLCANNCQKTKPFVQLINEYSWKLDSHILILQPDYGTNMHSSYISNVYRRISRISAAVCRISVLNRNFLHSDASGKICLCCCVVVLWSNVVAFMKVWIFVWVTGGGGQESFIKNIF